MDLDITRMKECATQTASETNNTNAKAALFVTYVASCFSTLIITLLRKALGFASFFETMWQDGIAAAVIALVIATSYVVTHHFLLPAAKKRRVGQTALSIFLLNTFKDNDFEMYRLVELVEKKKSYSDLTIREEEAVKQGYIYNLVDITEIASPKTLEEIGRLEWQDLDGLWSILTTSKQVIGTNPDLFECRLFDRNRRVRSTVSTC